MCVISGAAVGAAAALTANLAIATTAISVGMAGFQAQQARAQANQQMEMQAQQQQIQMNQAREAQILAQDQRRQAQDLQIRQQQQMANMQVEQANINIQAEYDNQSRAVRNERERLMSQYTADRIGYQRSVEQAQKQYVLNDDAANTAYQQEQTKLQEVRQKASFEAQAALAKSIGMKGKILASGRAGQSVGLLAMDVDRQAGFNIAAADASLESAKDAAGLAMDSINDKATSANNKAFSQIGFNPQKPYLPENPGTPEFVSPIGLGINV